jgi:hypothetical protein
MVGGKEARNELPTYGRHSAQFGIWFAKDHIKVERLNEAISHDNEYIHFMFVANSQDIELSANRETIRNKSSPVYQAIKEELEYYLSKVTQDPWFKNYLEIRKEGKHRRRTATQESSLKERRGRVKSNGFEPTTRTEVLLALERTNGNHPVSYTVEDFDPTADIQAIVSRDNELWNATVSHSLTDLLADEVPLGNVDVAVCWTHGDPAKLREYERHGYIGADIAFDLDNGIITYEGNTHSTIDILEVKGLPQEQSKAIADD